MVAGFLAGAFAGEPRRTSGEAVGASGGAGGLVLMVAIIGILAAVAIPAYQDYTVRAKITGALNAASEVKAAVGEYQSTHGEWPPASLSALGYPDDQPIAGTNGEYAIDLYDDGTIGIDVSAMLGGEKQFVVLQPAISGDGIAWSCSGEEVAAKYLPQSCR